MCENRRVGERCSAADDRCGELRPADRATPTERRMSQARPTLVYDGNCGICRYWVNYWQELTGDAAVYRPYQEAAADFPAIQW